MPEDISPKKIMPEKTGGPLSAARARMVR